jgi:hypothetical protein
MGHYDDIIEREEEREREEWERRRSAKAAETKANMIRIINLMDNDDIEFLKEFLNYLPALTSGDMKFVLDVMVDLPAYRGFFKVLEKRSR